MSNSGIIDENKTEKKDEAKKDPFKQNQAYIDAYYETNQLHVKWSFWASLGALSIGLGVLITGISLALHGSDKTISIVTSSAGVLTQFISAGFFILYSKNLKQLNVFYNQLIKNQDILFAWGMTSHVPEAQRTVMLQGIIINLLKRSDPDGTSLKADELLALAEYEKAKR